jgi:hypothetical protein
VGISDNLLDIGVSDIDHGCSMLEEIVVEGDADLFIYR